MFIQAIIYSESVCNKKIIDEFFNSLPKMLEKEKGILEVLEEIKRKIENLTQDLSKAD